MGLFGPNVERMTARRDVPGLVKLLDHRDEKLRSAAVAALAKMGDAPTSAALVTALESQVEMFWANAQQALIRIGKAAIPAVSAATRAHPTGAVRVRASYVLTEIQKAMDDLPSLREIARVWIDRVADAENIVRQNAVVGLNDIMTRFPDLVFQDSPVSVWREAAPRMVRALADAYVPARQNALAALSWALPHLGEMGLLEQASSSLVSVVADGQTRETVQKRLVQIGAPAVPALVAGMADRNPVVRQRTSYTLCDLLEPVPDAALAARVIAPLIQALGDTDAVARQNAVYGVGLVAPVLGAPEQRAAAAQGLARCLQDPADGVRANAAAALKGIADESLAPALLLALGDKAETVALHAAQGLGRSGGNSAVGALLQAWQGQTAPASVRQAAVAAIGMAVARNPELEQAGPAMAALRQALRDSDDKLSQTAEQALLEIGAPAREGLLRDFRGRDGATRFAAFRVLSKMGGEEALVTLLEAARDEHHWAMRRQAVETLGASEDPRAIEALLPLLSGSDDRLRAAAVRSLVQLHWTPTPDERGAFYYLEIEGKDWSRVADLGAPALRPLLGVYGRTHELDLARRLGQLATVTPDAGLAAQVVEALADDLHLGDLRLRQERAQILVDMVKSPALPEAARLKILSRRDEISRPHQDYSQHRDGAHFDISYGYAPANDCNENGVSAHTDTFVTDTFKSPGASHMTRVSERTHIDTGIGVPFEP